MDIEKSTHLKKCASLNNLMQNNNTATVMSVAQTQSNPAQRDHNLSLSLFTPRTRRFSCSSNGNSSSSGLISPGPRLAPRVSQLRQEEYVENIREVNHEREVHTALSISQSYEDLTLVMNENWSFKNNDEFSNPLHVSLPITNNSCSSPSPTSRQSVMRLCSSGISSPSPTRRSFATRRSMSPIAMRPSALGSVKRKFEMIEDGNSCSSSSQPYKKFFTESSSPIMSPLPICPSPDSSTTNSETFSGRTTPKMFVTKAFSSTFSSMTSSPLSTHSFENDSPSPSGNMPSSSSSSSTSSVSSKDNERMEVASTISADSGVANCDIGCDITTNEVVQNDTTLQKDNTGSTRDGMIIEEEVTPSNIPMTL